MSEQRLIDANAITGRIAKEYQREELRKDWNKHVWSPAMVCLMLENTPTIKPPVTRGMWVDVAESEIYSPDLRTTFTHTAETCSVCKSRIGFIGPKIYLSDNVCPNCGANMKEDSNH